MFAVRLRVLDSCSCILLLVLVSVQEIPWLGIPWCFRRFAGARFEGVVGQTIAPKFGGQSLKSRSEIRQT